jgi:hypothetical protein
MCKHYAVFFHTPKQGKFPMQNKKSRIQKTPSKGKEYS